MYFRLDQLMLSFRENYGLRRPERLFSISSVEFVVLSEALRLTTGSADMSGCQ